MIEEGCRGVLERLRMLTWRLPESSKVARLRAASWV